MFAYSANFRVVDSIKIQPSSSENYIYYAIYVRDGPYILIIFVLQNTLKLSYAHMNYY